MNPSGFVYAYTFTHFGTEEPKQCACAHTCAARHVHGHLQPCTQTSGAESNLCLQRNEELTRTSLKCQMRILKEICLLLLYIYTCDLIVTYKS